MSKIVFWSAGDDGSGWYRCTLPAEALNWLGHDVVVGTSISPELIDTADAIVASRVCGEGPSHIWREIASRPAGERPRLVLDVDDAYFSVPADNPSASVWTDPDNQRRLAQNMALADVVTCASEGIARDVVAGCGWLIGAGPERVEVIENGLHAGWLGRPREYRAATKNRPLVIGWAGSASTARDFDMITRPLGRLLKLYDGAVVARACGLPAGLPALNGLARAMGPNLTMEVAERFQAAEWIPHGQQYLDAVAEFDVWLAPYRADPFTNAKFPTKALEAGTLGIPLVASMTRPFQKWLTGAELGRTAGVVLVPEHAEHLWSSTIRRLIDQPGLRRAVGEAGRSRAALNIMQVLGPRWAKVVLG